LEEIEIWWSTNSDRKDYEKIEVGNTWEALSLNKDGEIVNNQFNNIAHIAGVLSLISLRWTEMSNVSKNIPYEDFADTCNDKMQDGENSQMVSLSKFSLVCISLLVSFNRINFNSST
jgi:hypothetical protein